MRLPRAALGLHVLEARARLGALAVARRERTRVRARRLVVVAEIAEHVAELDEQRGRLRSILVRAQLQLEELLHHVQLAERPVDRARRFEALCERWIQLVRVLEVLQRFHASEELLLENLTEAQMEARLRFVRALGLDSLFELFDEPLPVANNFELLQSILQVHGFPRLSQTENLPTAGSTLSERATALVVLDTKR